LELEPAKTETAFGRRMVEGLGEEGFRVAKTLQAHFGAKVVYYQDAKGEVGTDPRWPA
jgi:glutamate dehydrogenase/leucine dehydrogenase